MGEADGAVYEIEHLLNVTLRIDNLGKVMVVWETERPGTKVGELPDDGVKHALALRELRESHALKDRSILRTAGGRSRESKL